MSRVPTLHPSLAYFSNRPSVARVVQQKPFLINEITNSKSSKLLHFQTVRAKDLKFEKRFTTPCARVRQSRRGACLGRKSGRTLRRDWGRKVGLLRHNLQMFLPIFYLTVQNKKEIVDKKRFYYTVSDSWKNIEKKASQNSQKYSKKVAKTWNCSQSLADSEA